jgi:3-hydroxyanthranilate 3,4-dioxygenase
VNAAASALEARPFVKWIDSVLPELKPPVGQLNRAVNLRLRAVRGVFAAVMFSSFSFSLTFVATFRDIAGNKLMYDAGQMKIMVIGGPNIREDYHIEEGEEVFLMLRGDMVLDVIEHGKKRSIPIREGEMLLLPSRVPHSPQRPAGTVGLVIERDRLATEEDGLRWYIPSREGSDILYQEWFHCTDLGTQLRVVIERFFASDAHKTKIPPADLDLSEPVIIDNEATVPDPVNLRSWASSRCGLRGGAATLYGNDTTKEFRVDTSTGGSDRWSAAEGVVPKGEVFVFAVEGATTVHVLEHGAKTRRAVEVADGHVLLVPAGTGAVWIDWADGGLGLAVTNDMVP